MLENIQKLNADYRQRMDCMAHDSFASAMRGRLHFKRNVHHFSGWENMSPVEIRDRLMQIIKEPNTEFGLIDFANFLAFAHALDYTPEDIFGEMHVSIIKAPTTEPMYQKSKDLQPQPMPAPPPIHGTCEEPKAKD